MMINFRKVALLPVAATMALAGSVGVSATANAQVFEAPRSSQGTFLDKRYHDNVRRPLTVRRRIVRRAPAVVVAAPAVAPGPVVAAPIAAASTLVGLPFQVLGAAFPAGGPRKGGVTAVRYVGAGAETTKIDEGWAEAVPVDKSGPIFVVENGDPTISPLTFVGAPIAAAGSIAQLPFRVLGAGPTPGTF